MLSTQQFMSVVNPVIADQLQQFPVIMQLAIAGFMNDQGATGGATSRAPVFNTGDKLYKVSGKLFQSFIKGNANNIYKMKQSGNSFELQYGTKSKYAAIHEFGGFIKGTPITVIKSKSGRKMRKETVKMAQYFWAQYYKTKSPFFQKIALAAEKNKGVNIKARPFFAPAIKEFKTDYQKLFEQKMKQEIVRAVLQMQNSNRD